MKDRGLPVPQRDERDPAVRVQDGGIVLQEASGRTHLEGDKQAHTSVRGFGTGDAFAHFRQLVHCVSVLEARELRNTYPIFRACQITSL